MWQRKEIAGGPDPAEKQGDTATNQSRRGLCSPANLKEGRM